MVAVKSSFQRCDLSNNFADVFYEKFIPKSKAIAIHFEGTDFFQQKKLLRATVKVLVNKNFENSNTQKVLNSIGNTHNRFGYAIEPHLYDFWLDALIETIEVLDENFSGELEQAWRLVMSRSIEVIISKY